MKIGNYALFVAGEINRDTAKSGYVSDAEIYLVSTILHLPVARNGSAFLYFISCVSTPFEIITLSFRSNFLFMGVSPPMVIPRMALWITPTPRRGSGPRPPSGGRGPPVPVPARFGKIFSTCVIYEDSICWNILSPSLLYSTSGSRCPYARRFTLERKYSIASRWSTQRKSTVCKRNFCTCS